MNGAPQQAVPAARWPWWLCALAGLVVIGAMACMNAIPGQLACDGQGGNPMLRFEMVTSAQDLATLFGNDPCRSSLAAAMDAVNHIDGIAYIPAFTLLQIFAAIGWWRRGRALAIAVIVVALIAAGCDYLEDSILTTKTFELLNYGAVDGDAITLLMVLVRAKFALLSLAAMMLGYLARGDGDGGWWRWVGTAMIGGGVFGLLGIVFPAGLGLGIGVAWALLFAVALVRSVQPAAIAPSASPSSR